MKKLLLPISLFLVQLVVGQTTTVKTMFYNVLNYPTAPPQNREAHLRNILNAYEPDIFMVAELESQEGADEILEESLNFYGDFFEAAPFVPNTSATWGEQLQQMLFYRSNTFDLVETDIVQTYLRDINMYKLQLLSQDGPEDIFFYVFVAHLKASSGTDNEQSRLEMVQDLTAYLNTLPADAMVLFAGDFNLYSAGEPAYAELLNFAEDNNITFADPINEFGDWHNNSTYAGIHTQSTRLSNAPFDSYGAGGGLDDRFDFILVSENLMNETAPVHFIENSYEAFGNNGNCFNQNINDSDCNGDYSQAIRESLYQMSDHLPVVMELETSQTLSIPAEYAVAQVELLSGNLVKDNLRIKLPQEMEGTNIEIFNSLGQKLQNISEQNTLILDIEISSLPTGLYFLVFENSKIAPVKFIKTP